ncbi:hypothetical protein BGX27_006196 [Mortierella sp. AM989]|nr:hypothetical protein BGX27_006196 [Mortierella sp. AM989]
MGLGQGLIFQNCMLACQECAGAGFIAVATALCGFINSIGSSIGVAICAAVFNNALVKNLAELPADVQKIAHDFNVIENMNAIADLPAGVRELVIQGYSDSFKSVFIALTPIMGFAFLMSLFIRGRGSLAKA